MGTEPGLPLRTITAAYPGPTEPRRGHFIENLHRHLPNRFRTEVVTPRVFESDPEHEARETGAVTRFSYGSRGLPKSTGMSPWSAWRYLRAGRQAARRVWPRSDAARGGLVLAHWVVPSGWIGLDVARRLGVPLVLYAHGSDLHTYGDRFPFRGWTGRIIRSGLTIVVSRHLATIAARLSGQGTECFPVLPVGIEDDFHGEPSPPDDGPLRFLYVGDLIPSKGVPELVAAVTALRAGGQEIALELIGDGPLRETLKRNRSVAACGALPASKIRQSLEACHYLILPSHREGTPLVVQEALALGRPAVTTAVGGIPDLYEERHGWVQIPQPGERPITEVLQQLLSEGVQGWQRRRTEMEKNRVEDLFQSDRSRRLATILESALAGGGKASA